MLFYDDLHPVNPEVLRDRRLLPPNTFRFAASTNSVPLAMTEFILAARELPIVFTDPAQGEGGQIPMAVAILGYRHNDNCMVNIKNGKWSGSRYIPAYIRRFPFAVASVGRTGTMMLAVTMHEERISKSGSRRGEAFYAEGDEPTEALERCQSFCEEYQEHLLLTQELGRALVDCELLEPRTANIELDTGENHALRGFQMVSEERLAKLPERVVHRLHRQGFLAPIYFHLQSMQNWSRLLGD